MADITRIHPNEAVADVRAAFRQAVSKGENEPYISHVFTPPPITGNCMECEGTGYVRWHAIADHFNPEGYYEADPCDACGCTGNTMYARLEQQHERLDQQASSIHVLVAALADLMGYVEQVINLEPYHLEDLEELYDRINRTILNPPEPEDPV